MACARLLSLDDLCRFRTKQCRRLIQGSCNFGFDRCQYSHNIYWGRRCPFYLTDPGFIRYIPVLCPNVVDDNEVIVNNCNRGGECPYAHSNEEIFYHPLFYKTKACSSYQSGKCKSYYCPFIHGLAEARTPPKYKLPFTHGLLVPEIEGVSLVDRIGIPGTPTGQGSQTPKQRYQWKTEDLLASTSASEDTPSRTTNLSIVRSDDCSTKNANLKDDLSDNKTSLLPTTENNLTVLLATLDTVSCSIKELSSPTADEGEPQVHLLDSIVAKLEQTLARAKTVRRAALEDHKSSLATVPTLESNDEDDMALTRLPSISCTINSELYGQILSDADSDSQRSSMSTYRGNHDFWLGSERSNGGTNFNLCIPFQNPSSSREAVPLNKIHPFSSQENRLQQSLGSTAITEIHLLPIQNLWSGFGDTDFLGKCFEQKLRRKRRKGLKAFQWDESVDVPNELFSFEEYDFVSTFSSLGESTTDSKNRSHV